MTTSPKISELLPGHAAQVAQLHISAIGTGFISSLGIDSVTALYEAIAESEFGFGLVAQKANKVVGFAAFTTNLGNLYKSVVFRKGLRLVLLTATRMFSFHRMKKALETLFYPTRAHKMHLPPAELLSIAVSEQERGRGLAAQLLQKGLGECASRGIREIKVLVGADMTPANRLYVKCGFELVGQIDSHGIVSNVYTVKVS